MTYNLQFRRYALPFRHPVRTGHGLWEIREGLVVRIEDESGRIGFGEAAPIPGFGTEDVTADEAALQRLGNRIDDQAIGQIPAALGCSRRALADAVGGAGREATDKGGGWAGGPALPVAALLPAGKAALRDIEAKAEAGFRTFKWKVGVGDADEELGLLDEICAKLPGGGRLRLDANGAWDRRRAERWLERCAERPVEFVEQPTAARGAAVVGAAALRSDDILMGLAQDYPTPIGLDESLAGDADLERWVAAGWPGIFVIKPALLGLAQAAAEKLRGAMDRVVFSSALETALGAQASLRTAFEWTRSLPHDRPARALGFGVYPLFADARFDGPPALPFIRERDLESFNPEDLWNALN